MDKGKIGFCSVIVLWYTLSWRLTLIAKLGSHFIFHECMLCILKILFTLSGVVQLVDQREALRRCQHACSLAPCSCRFLGEGGNWLCLGHTVWAVDTLVPQGSAGKHVPMVDSGSFPVHMFNGFLASEHKNRNFGHSRLKIMSIFTEFYFLWIYFSSFS